MDKLEKIISGLACCLGVNDCDIERNECCPYNEYPICATFLHSDVIELLKEQRAVIEKYHKADNFLEAHGWKWE